jgi:hypothetical protein
VRGDVGRRGLQESARVYTHLNPEATTDIEVFDQQSNIKKTRRRVRKR